MTEIKLETSFTETLKDMETEPGCQIETLLLGHGTTKSTQTLHSAQYV